MTETMVNGIIFKVWSDFNAKCTLAENEDGDVRIIQSAGYISNDLTIRKAIAMVFGLPTFRKNAVKTAKAVEETPVTKSKEQDEQETVEGISKMETTTETDDSGFEYTRSQAQEVIMTGTSINLSQAQKICQEIESEYAVKRMQGSVKWNDVFSSEQEILAALGKIYIPKSRTAPVSTFKGYAYIYSFAYYVQQGWTLSDKQMKQCKRLAVEIRKAAAIAEYKF